MLKRRSTWKSQERLNESLAGEVLLKHALGVQKAEVLEKSNGKPFVKGAPCFSVSHSSGVVACLVSENGEVGLDVQKICPQAGTVIGRYGTENEKAFCTDTASYTFVWTAKEAVFKHGGEQFTLVKQAELTGLLQKGNDYFAQCGKLAVRGYKWQNYVVSYVCDDDVETVVL